MSDIYIKVSIHHAALLNQRAGNKLKYHNNNVRKAILEVNN